MTFSDIANLFARILQSFKFPFLNVFFFFFFKVCGTEFSNFAEVTLEEIKKFTRKLLSKSCELDPLPAVVLKGCLTVLLPTITRIINLSLSTVIWSS